MKINLKLIEVEASKEEIVKDVPNIIESFEMRKNESSKFLSITNLLVSSSRMRKDGFKVTIGGHGVDELLIV